MRNLHLRFQSRQSRERYLLTVIYTLFHHLGTGQFTPSSTTAIQFNRQLYQQQTKLIFFFTNIFKKESHLTATNRITIIFSSSIIFRDRLSYSSLTDSKTKTKLNSQHQRHSRSPLNLTYRSLISSFTITAKPGEKSTRMQNPDEL